MTARKIRHAVAPAEEQRPLPFADLGRAKRGRLYYMIGGDRNYIEITVTGPGRIEVRGCDGLAVRPHSRNVIRIEAEETHR